MPVSRPSGQRPCWSGRSSRCRRRVAGDALAGDLVGADVGGRDAVTVAVERSAGAREIELARRTSAGSPRSISGDVPWREKSPLAGSTNRGSPMRFAALPGAVAVPPFSSSLVMKLEKSASIVPPSAMRSVWVKGGGTRWRAIEFRIVTVAGPEPSSRSATTAPPAKSATMVEPSTLSDAVDPASYDSVSAATPSMEMRRLSRISPVAVLPEVPVTCSGNPAWRRLRLIVIVPS